MTALAAPALPTVALTGPAWLLLLALAALVLLAWHLTYTAARLDRLHTRAEGALSALDGQLVRRAEAALALASSGLLDPTAAGAVGEAASACLASPGFRGDALDEPGVLPAAVEDRAAPENRLSAALRDALDAPTVARLRLDPAGAAHLERVAATGLRVGLAHAFHTDAVEDAARLRRAPLVRVFRLAGHAALPVATDLDVAGPPALTNR